MYYKVKEPKKLFTEYKIFVGARTFEVSHTAQRRDFIIPILQDMYPNETVKAEPYRHYIKGDFNIRRMERIIAEQIAEYSNE